MIDLHCHLLPGIDDGPATLEEAVELARLAVKNGIRHSVVTPHIHPGRYQNQLSSLEPALGAFRQALAEREIPLALSLGGEVRLSIESVALIRQAQVPMVGRENGYDIMLLELPHGHIPPGSDKLVSYLLARNIRPMIAHPERNRDVIRSLDKILPFLEAGCLLQVTAGSLAGDFGKPARNRAFEMLERGWITVLASDAHNTRHRPPNLEPGRAGAARVIGETAANDLVRRRPASILGLTDKDL